jgi:hypothetical protein
MISFVAKQDGRLGDASLPQKTYTADTQERVPPERVMTAQAEQDGRLGV